MAMAAFAVLLGASLVVGLFAGTASATPAAEKIYVHVVPHTHDDVGWLKTVDEYYYGANDSIQHAGVQWILDSVIDELQKDKNRTFIYVEMAFFTRWWNEQSDNTKQIVRGLVDGGQLEFVNAGWCMNDEASTDYGPIIDQMSEGLRFVEANFGVSARPRVAWHIDPFGHSAEQAALFALMGYDGFFFARNDYDDRKARLKAKTMEMVWRPSQSLGEAAEIFTGVLYYGYGPPPGFCWDIYCTDPPMQDDPDLFDNNVDERIATFVKDVIDQASHYATNHIMFTMGSDFQYENAHEWYKNLDKLIYYISQKVDEVEVFYSTPSRYIDAVHNAGITWTVKTDDFFPYADSPYSYWTGYFTSRPALKAYTRQTNSLLQTCKQIEVFGSPLLRSTQASSKKLKEALGVDQHHDAVSGTEKQHVANDYAKRLHIGQTDCQTLLADVMGTFVASKSQSPIPQYQFCEYLNVSVCPASETGSFNLLAYNPLSYGTDVFFRVPVNSMDLSVYDYMGKPVLSQVMNVSNSTRSVRRNHGNASYELIFVADLPPVGGMMFIVRPTKASPSSRFNAAVSKQRPHRVKEDFSISNTAMNVTFDGATGRVKMIVNKLTNVQASVDQQFMWWNSSDGHNVNSSQASGAYIFRPNGTAPFEINKGNVATVSIVEGPIFTEVQQEFAPWVTQSVRLYAEIPIVEFEYTIGPIPFDDSLGKEIISRFSTDINNDGVWYTDANGREMQTRKRNFRPTWDYNNTEPVAGNYYPVNSRIYMRDDKRDLQFTVLNDRSQGGSSLNDGQLELMVHRRCLHDDSRGVGEPLNETGVFGDGLIIRGSHFVFLDNIVNSTYWHRVLARNIMLRPAMAFEPSTDSVSDVMDKYFTIFEGITRELPLNVQLLTLEFITKTSLLLRLEHTFEIDEAPYNTSVTVELSDLFNPFKVVGLKEEVLGANADISTVHRLKWKTDVQEGATPQRPHPHPVRDNSTSVVLLPMDIRTFIITVAFY